MPLPTNRSTANTPAEHVADHNTGHGLLNTLEGEPAARAAADALLIPLTQKGAASGVASLDATGLVPYAQMPNLVLGNTYSVATQAAMLALAATKGDMAIRTDFEPDKFFILTSNSPGTLADWKEISLPGTVGSVDGQTGAVVLSGTYVPSAGAATKAGNLTLTGGVIVKDDAWIDPRAFPGWDPIAADNITAIQAAANAAKAKKGSKIVLVPGQKYSFSTMLDFNSCQGCSIEGAAGSGLGLMVPDDGGLIFTGAGAGAALSARSTQSFKMERARLFATNAAFTGTILDARGGLPGFGDTITLKLVELHIGGSTTAANAAQAISLDQVISSELTDIVFQHIVNGINGKAGGVDTYAVQIGFNGLRWLNFSGYCVKNAGMSWVFRDCTFENRLDGKAGAYMEDFPSYSLFFSDGCWFGDATVDGLPWIKTKGNLLVVSGCDFAPTGPANAPAIEVGAVGSAMEQVVIRDSYFLMPTAIKTLAGAGIGEFIAEGNVTTSPYTLYDESLNVFIRKTIIGNRGTGNVIESFKLGPAANPGPRIFGANTSPNNLGGFAGQVEGDLCFVNQSNPGTPWTIWRYPGGVGATWVALL